jgi:hypothetical protein
MDKRLNINTDLLVNLVKELQTRVVELPNKKDKMDYIISVCGVIGILAGIIQESSLLSKESLTLFELGTKTSSEEEKATLASFLKGKGGNVN